MKILRIFIISLLLLLVMVFAGWKMRTFFLQNHVTFLLNQEEIPAALNLVTRLESQNPDSLTVQFLRIKALTIAGQMEKALQAPFTDTLADKQPEALYWRALAQYHLGDEAAARETAAKFLASGGGLASSGSSSLVRHIAGQNAISADIDTDSDSFRMLFDVEKTLHLAFAASQQLEAGRAERANELYEHAFALGLRSDKVLPDAVRAAALTGASQSADMFLDYASPETVDVLFKEFRNNYEQFQSPAMVLNESQAFGSGGRLARARALAWITVAHARQSLELRGEDSVKAISALKTAFPNDPQLQMRAAELMEILGRKDEAQALYNKVHAEAPNLTAAFRIWALDKLEESDISRRLGSVLKLAAPVAVISTGTLTTGLKSDLINPDKPAVFSFSVPKQDSYVITIIAKGNPAGINWPLLQVDIDENLLGMKYINRSNWESYSLQAQLVEGEHSLELEDKSDLEPSHPIELMAIIVAPPVSQQ